MILEKFASLIQVAVTLNVAFVAVEYIKNYSKVLYTQVFKFGEYVEDSFDTNKLGLADKLTLWSMQTSVVNGKSTAGMIEGLKRKWEKLNTDILSNKQSFSLQIEEMSLVKNLSSISLWFFLYGLTALFLIGIGDEVETLSFWMFLSLGTLMYALWGWFSGEKRHKPVADFSSLFHPVVWFIGVVILCGILSIFIPREALTFWEKILGTDVCLLSLPLQFCNFIIPIIKASNKVKKIKKDIQKVVKGLKDECEDLNKDLQKLISLGQVAEQLLAEA